ncbi:hypothetical protein [Cryptosporangium phraense]|uniref:Uncharacterized protein n=1 Tax=Cryptosporangium phraense TaxID=2593070 RepID=A0A545AVK1_9ACTN|nr:hypothetical protein [Cryptosporangium phraense]TQS45368.1 hypothetical protein FL583_09805 [Cryptosporangium phraense]
MINTDEAVLNPRIVRIATADDPHAVESHHARSVSPGEMIAGTLVGRREDGSTERVEAFVRVCGGPHGTNEFTIDLGNGKPLSVPAEPQVEEWLRSQPLTWA